MKNRRLKLILALCFIFSASLISYGIFYYVRQLSNVSVTVSIVPSDAKITFNGDKSHGGTVWLKPGKYLVEVSKEGFETHKTEVEIFGGNTIVASLLPASPQAKEWFDKNYDKYKKQENLTNHLSDMNMNAMMEKYSSLSDELPISLPSFNIEYRVEENTEPTIYIDSYIGSRNDALAKLYEVGIDPANYNVVFNNYKNPFEELP